MIVRAAEQGHEPVEALELKPLHDDPIVIYVRLAGYACCYADTLLDPMHLPS